MEQAGAKVRKPIKLFCLIGKYWIVRKKKFKLLTVLSLQILLSNLPLHTAAINSNAQF